MAEKVLLCVGCDRYDHLSPLFSAELDAERILQEFTKNSLSLINHQNTALLLSPNTNELRAKLESIQDRHPNIDSLTVFFAGHGGISNGSYYLCLKDTRQDRLATTGIALSHFFEFLNEVKAAHCNLIIDACQAGGITSDIGTLLKPDIIGKAKSCGVSIFASSASDQYASEDSTGGYGTTAILKVLRGEIDTNSRAPFLDLLDIGRAASLHVAESTSGTQLPSIWGMNLYGPIPLYKNPYATELETSSFKKITGLSPTSTAGILISENSENLFSLAFLPEADLTSEKIFEVLSTHTNRIKEIPGAAAALISGVWSSLENKCRNHTNSFSFLQFTATCISLLLESAKHDHSSSTLIKALSENLCAEVEILIRNLIEALRAEPRTLCRHGIPDLFYLPQRISRILGWSSAALYISEQYKLENSNLNKLFTEISRQILDEYAASSAGMSECETPFWTVFLASSLKIGNKEFCEQIIGSLYTALVENHGALARTNLKSKSILSYLKARDTRDTQTLAELSGRPSEALAFTLLSGKILGLEDIIDIHLERLDHSNLNIFIPEEYSEFSSPCIQKGRNHVFQIGHGLWRTDNLIERWHSSCAPQIQKDKSLDIAAIRVGAVCCSLVFPNRVPWFILKEYL
ncbi:caspase family protein [Pseudomonas oryzihabitans]|uniref:caspase family protein n=1 Tax=Pseudomonas oryzihabitans TaxID=47885 RepID=UPI00241BF91B|nr:caspase family protein [Pseudomonas oryzihabitans]